MTLLFHSLADATLTSQHQHPIYGPVAACWPADSATLGLDLYNDPVDGPTIRRTAMTGRPAATSPSRPRFGAGNGDPAALGANLHVPLFRYFAFPSHRPAWAVLLGRVFLKSPGGAGSAFQSMSIYLGGNNKQSMRQQNPDLSHRQQGQRLRLHQRMGSCSAVCRQRRRLRAVRAAVGRRAVRAGPLRDGRVPLRCGRARCSRSLSVVILQICERPSIFNACLFRALVAHFERCS